MNELELKRLLMECLDLSDRAFIREVRSGLGGAIVVKTQCGRFFEVLVVELDELGRPLYKGPGFPPKE